MEYRTTKEQCAKNIHGVCSRCGGKLEPIETVDNGHNPIFWSGCTLCCCFDNGVDPKIYNIAKKLVEDGCRPYSHIREDKQDDEEMKIYKKREQIAGTCSIVRDVLRLSWAEKGGRGMKDGGGAIGIGDLVDVLFEHVQSEHGVRVIYVPCDTGDSWHFKREDGTTVYVQNFSKIVRVKQAEPIGDVPF